MCQSFFQPVKKPDNTGDADFFLSTLDTQHRDLQGAGLLFFLDYLKT
jgi:hypothetical protein